MSATKEKVRTGTQEVRYSTTGNRYNRSGMYCNDTRRHRLVDCRCNHAFGRGNGRQCHFTRSTSPYESIEKGELVEATFTCDPSAKEDFLHEVHPQSEPQWCVNDKPPSQYNDTTTHNLPKNHLISTMILDNNELSPTHESNMPSKPTSARKQTSICHPNNRRRVQRGDHRRIATTINEFETTLERPPRSQQRCKTKRGNEHCKDTASRQHQPSKHISSQQPIQSPTQTVQDHLYTCNHHPSINANANKELTNLSSRKGSSTMYYKPPYNPSSLLRERERHMELPSTHEKVRKIRSNAK
jgi:hypothetical protein